MSAEPDPELVRLQRWMLAVVTDPGGVRAGLASDAARDALGDGASDVGRIVRDLPDLGAAESLGVYAGMYVERMVGVLSDDYPAVGYFLGRECWRATASRYVAQHPSTFRSLNSYGRDLPAFLVAEGADDAAFLAELAQLEASIRRAFRAPDAPVLSIDEFLAVPQDAWPGRPLPLVPSVELFAFAYPIERVYRAWRHDEEPAAPDPEASFAVVWRRDGRVWRRELSLEQHVLLTELASGATLGVAIDAVAERDDVDLAALGAGLSAWFRDWCAEEFFVGRRDELTGEERS